MKYDNRYTLTKEFTGVSQKMYVIRFQGTWIGQHPTKEGAIAMKRAYEFNRWR